MLQGMLDRYLLATLGTLIFQALQSAGISEPQCFLSVTEARLLGANGLGRVTTAQVMRVQAEIRNMVRDSGGLETPNWETRLAEQLQKRMGPPRLSEGLVFSNSPEETDLLQAIIDTFQSRTASRLRAYQVDDLATFLNLTPAVMVDWHHFGRVTLARIADVQAKLHCLMLEARDHGEPLAGDRVWTGMLGITRKRLLAIEERMIDLDDPFPTIKAWLESNLSARTVRAFMLCNGMLGEPPKSYRGVGVALGTSRERARQLNHKTLRFLSDQQRPLRPLCTRAAEIAKVHSGSISLPELTALLLVRGSRGTMLRYAAPFILQLANLPVWADAGLTVADDLVCVGTQIPDSLAK